MSLGNFNQYAPVYVANWNKLVVRSNRLAEANTAARALIAGKAMYQACADACGNSIPWWFFGLCLYRENTDDFLNQRFESYLGNGQPLDRRTTEVPAGRGPWKTFVAGAVDAMRLQGFIGATDWGVARTSYRLEGMNGFGYHIYGVNSPYLDGGTTLYGPPQAKGGKYVADHDFDPNHIDTQLGTLAILKCAMVLDPSIVFTSAPAPQPDDNLGKGVAWVQQSLNTLDQAGLAVDGILGQKTMAAVEAYQRAHGLRVDGLPGTQTIASLQAQIETPAAEHAVRLMGRLYAPPEPSAPCGSLSTDKALDALDEAVYKQIKARFHTAIANEYAPKGAFARIKRSVSPPNLDRAVDAFDRGMCDMLNAYVRCRDVILKRL